MDYNETYSFKDFSNQSFAMDLIPPGTIIRGTCFYQEGRPDSHIFPETMTGVTFERCNLDNCYIPPGNVLAEQAGIPCSNKQIMVQNDLRDWQLDAEGNLIEVMGKKFWESEGVNVHCNDILKPLTSIDQLYQIAEAIG